jgi:hypothetical protein
MGKFSDKLNATAGDVNESRKAVITERVKTSCKRFIEDAKQQIRTTELEMEEMLDFSGVINGDIHSTVNFDGVSWINAYVQKGGLIFNLNLSLTESTRIFDELFDEE